MSFLADSVDRLAQLVDRKLVSCVKRDRDAKIIFFRQITVELERFGAKQLVSSLADAIPGAEYGKLFHGYKVVKCSIKNLVAFFDGTTSERGDSGDTTQNQVSSGKNLIKAYFVKRSLN